MKKSHLLGVMCACSFVFVNQGVSAAIISGWGAQADSSTASSCPSFCQGITTNSDGGESFNTASSSISNTSGDAMTEVTLSGTSFTPVLKAFGDSNSSTGAFATATGVQGYTFTGATGRDITIDINIDRVVDTTTSGSQATVEAQMAIIFTDELFFTTDFGTAAFEAAPPGSLAASIQLFDSDFVGNTLADSLTFFVNPGDDFFVWTGLQVDAERGGMADAFNTMTMSFDNDAGLIAASASVVPVPAAVWLFGSGLLGLIGIARRKKST